MLGVVSCIGVVAVVGSQDACGANPFDRILRAADDAKTDSSGVYAESNGTSLHYDLFLPEGDRNPPLVIYVHGGGWSSGSRTLQHASAPLELCRRGYAVASVDYRLTSEGATWPEPADDVGEAVAFFLADGLNGLVDPERVAIFGASAGGHLASFVTLNWNDADRRSGDGPSLRGAILAAGPTDFTDDAVRTWADDTTPAEDGVCDGKGAAALDVRCALGNPDTWPCVVGPNEPCTNVLENTSLRLLGCQPATVNACGELADHPLAATASPLTWVDGCDPPHMVIYDDAELRVDANGRLRGDALVPPSQGRRLIDELSAVGVDTSFSLAAPETGHGVDQGSPATLDAMADFLDKIFSAPQPNC